MTNLIPDALGFPVDEMSADEMSADEMDTSSLEINFIF